MNQYDLFDYAFSFYNEKLFQNQLPKVFFTLMKKKNMGGYYKPESFQNKNEEKTTIDEICLNPDFFQEDQKDVMSTLVHEMCHLYECKFFEHPKNGYHSKTWGSMMESVGLMPSHNGQPEGKKTGRKMHHYIIENGKFDNFTNELLSQKNIIEWFSSIEIGKKSKSNRNKIKYTCECDNKIWGKPGLKVMCYDCYTEFMEAIK